MTLNKVVQYTDSKGEVYVKSDNGVKSMVGSLNVSYANQISHIFGKQKVVFALDGFESKISLDIERSKYLEFIPIKSSGPNQNIIIQNV
jgi:hypothetical protein